jgi:Fe-S cluster biogenesis protein NfuA
MSPDQAIEDVVVHRIRPALSSHAGSIRVELVDERDKRVHLSWIGSCAACYFKQGCTASLVEPEIRREVGQQWEVVVRRARWSAP